MASSSLRFQREGEKTPFSRNCQIVPANPFEQKIFNALLTQHNFQAQVFAGPDELKESHRDISIRLLLLRTELGSWRWHEGVHIHYVKVKPVIHKELNRFLKIYSSLPWGTDYQRRSRKYPA